MAMFLLNIWNVNFFIMIQVNNKYKYGDVLCRHEYPSVGLVVIAIRILVKNTGISVMYDCRPIDGCCNPLNPFDFYCFNESMLKPFNYHNVQPKNSLFDEQERSQEK